MAQLGLDDWAKDHEMRRMDELYNTSVRSPEAMRVLLQELRNSRVVSKTTLLDSFGISYSEELRRLKDERVG